MKSIEPQLDLVIDAGNYLGESPIWSITEQALYWINCEQPAEVHRWDIRTRERQVWPMPKRVGGICFKSGGGLVVTLSDGIYDMQLPSGELSLRVRSTLQHAALHESGCDRDGRMWVGGMDHRIGGGQPFTGDAKLSRLEKDRLIPFVAEIMCSNALGFSPDGTTLYHSDSLTGVVKAWHLDRATGALSNESSFATLPSAEGFYDGATVDALGGFWATRVFGSALRRYHPDGSVDFDVRLPFSNPTKLAFGGADLETLFITSTKMSIGTPLKGVPMLGGVYAFRPGFKGLPEPAVRQ